MAEKENAIKDGAITTEVLGFVGEDLVNLETGRLIEDPLKIRMARRAGVPVLQEGQDELAVGYVISEYQTTPMSFLRDLKEYDRAPDDVYKQIDICNKVYRQEGTIGTAIDILVEFAVTDVMIEDVEDDRAKNLLGWFNRNINGSVEEEDASFSIGIKNFLQQGALEYFVSGNAFPYKVWKKIEVPVLNKAFNLPIQIRYLNPQTIYIPELPNAFGKQLVYLRPLPVYKDLLNSAKTKEEQELLNLVPKDLREFLKNGRELKKLDSRFVTHISRNKRDYEAWGTPYLLRVLNAVSSKKKLRMLDDATVEGMVNYVTIYKIGSDDVNSPYHKVTPARLAAFRSLLKNPNATTTLVWPHDLAVEQVGPEGKVLEFNKKYNEANEEIIRALGVPRVLIDGEGRINAQWVTIAALIERLEQIRGLWASYLEGVYREIMEENGFPNIYPKVKWEKMNLRNEKEVKNMILAFYDRGLLPIETALNEAGYDFKEQLDRQEHEIKKEVKKVFVKPALPFDGGNNAPNNAPNDTGRPTDNTDEKIETTDTQTSSKASVFQRKYLENLQVLYGKVLEKLKKKVKAGDISREALRLVIGTGFYEMEEFSNLSLEVEFNETTGLQDDENEIMKQRLVSWNQRYMDQFQKDLLSRIENAVFSGIKLENDLVIAMLVGVFQEESYRLPMYAEEGLRKATFAGELYNKATAGAQGGFLRAVGPNPCAACTGHDGNWYDVETLFTLWPLHPHCTCDVEYTEENPIASGEHQNIPVQQDPKNPSELI